MERVLFAKGVKGEIIKDIQRRLTSNGFNTKGIDGAFGENTKKAVTAFQQQHQLAQTGDIDVTTYRKLMEHDIPPVAERSLQLTALFEGHGFTLAQGNFDGAGITWGIIGFTLKHGNLKQIITEANHKFPELVRNAFQDKTDELLTILKQPMSKQLAFADSISLGTNKVKLKEPWRSAFQRFGENQEIQQLQLTVADRNFFQPALLTARRFNLKTELGIALAFDIHVQNGSIKDSAREQIERELSAHTVATEQELRVIIANAVADKANPKFREDVRSRKLTLATGSGKVHGTTFVLRNWGLDEVPV